MILHALHDYYERRQSDSDAACRLPDFGLEQKEISFILELSAEGDLKGITETRQQLGARKVGTPRRVPMGAKKTSGIASNLLWENAEYLLGMPDTKKLEAAQAKGKAGDYLARLADMQAAFRARMQALPEPARADEGVRAVLAFMAKEPAMQAQRFGAAWAEIAATNPTISLRLVGDDALVCQRPGVAPFVVAAGADEGSGGGGAMAAEPSQCLVTGATAPIERLHASIKGVWGAQTSGANIVSFNLEAFNSYGKAQGANAPVSESAAFAYTTALNALLARDSTQRIQVGDASTVFWAQRQDPLEDELTQLLGGGEDDPDAHVRQVRSLYESVHKGGLSEARGDNRFFVLGLAPNAARIAVRFWHAAPLREVAQRIVTWFDDLSLAGAPYDPQYPSLRALLRAVVLQRKDDNIPPNLGGDVLRAIFTGTAFPPLWLNLAVQRCRAEQEVSHLRACVIKACLNRSIRLNRSTTEEEYAAMLDTNNTTPAYRLGRLFAVLEKIQEESAGGQLNKTIRDRYYGAASSTPASVVPLLLKLKNHHLGKLDDRGQRLLYRAFQDHRPDDYIGAVLQGVDDIPAHLSLPQQGRFALGYYHQRQAFFTKATEAGTANTEQTTSTTNEGRN
jgi:CRISPR-associated protein Csd1